MEEFEIEFDPSVVEEFEIEMKDIAQEVFPPLVDLKVVASGEDQVFTHEGEYGYDEVTVKGIKMQDKVVDVTEDEQIIEPDEEYAGLSSVKVNKPNLGSIHTTASRYSDTVLKAEKYGRLGFYQVTIGKVTNGIDSNIKPENIRDGVEILGVTGEFVGAKYKPRVISFYEFTGTELDYELANLDFSELTSMSQMFYGNTNLTKIDLRGKDTSKVKSLYRTFYKCNKAEEINLTGCDLSNVENISAFLYNVQGLKTLLLDDSIKRAKIKICTSAFSNNGTWQKAPCDGNLDLSEWDFSEASDFSNMFSSTYWQNINLSGVITSKATDMGEMFFGNSGGNGPKTIDFTGCDTSNVEDFHQCFCVGGVRTLDISMFDFSSANSINGIFSNCGIANLKFGKNLGKGYTSKTAKSSAYQLGFFYSSYITRESMVNVFENLYDLNLTYDVANGGTLYTQEVVIYSSSPAARALTAEDIAIATNKGWTVRIY